MIPSTWRDSITRVVQNALSQTAASLSRANNSPLLMVRNVRDPRTPSVIQHEGTPLVVSHAAGMVNEQSNRSAEPLCAGLANVATLQARRRRERLRVGGGRIGAVRA
jgi:hypothetical protein